LFHQPGRTAPCRSQIEYEDLYADDNGLGPVDEDEDEPGLPEEIEDRENQAGTEQMDSGKFKRD
jgi:hypothetical protein